jgi:hypothetical protein
MRLGVALKVLGAVFIGRGITLLGPLTLTPAGLEVGKDFRGRLRARVNDFDHGNRTDLFARGEAAMIRNAVYPFLVLLVLVGGRGTATQAQPAVQTLSALPGESFGPLTIGHAPTPGWDVSCGDVRRRLSGQTITSYNATPIFFYAQLGLEVSVTSKRDGRPGLPESRIEGIRTAGVAQFDPGPSPALFPNCTTRNGESTDPAVKYDPPSSTIYVTSKGARLGSNYTFDQITAMHGRSAATWVVPGGFDVLYCGMGLGLRGGTSVTAVFRLEEITVAHPQLWPEVFRSHCRR